MRTFTTALSLLALAALDQTNAIELTSAAQAEGIDECTVLDGKPGPPNYAKWIYGLNYNKTAEDKDITKIKFTSKNEGQNQVTDEPLSFPVAWVECFSRGADFNRQILATIEHTFEDGKVQSASYYFQKFLGKFEVPLDSELLTDGGIGGQATKTFTMDSFDDTVSHAIAYENADCTGIQQVIQGNSFDEFKGFNKAEISTPIVSTPIVSMGGDDSGDQRGDSVTSTTSRGGSVTTNRRGNQLAQVQQQVVWKPTYAKSFKLFVRASDAGGAPIGYSLKTASHSDTYEYSTSRELVTGWRVDDEETGERVADYEVCVENTDPTQIYAKIMTPE